MMKKITCGSKVGSLPNGPYIYICSQSYSTKLATKFCDLPFFAVAKFSHLNANSGKSNSSACKWLYGCYASVQDVTFLLYTQSHQTYIFQYSSVYMRYAHFPPYAHFTPHYPMCDALTHAEDAACGQPGLSYRPGGFPAENAACEIEVSLWENIVPMSNRLPMNSSASNRYVCKICPFRSYFRQF